MAAGDPRRREAVALGATARDLRGALSAVRMRTRALLEERRPSADGPLLDLVDRIEASTREAEELVNHIARAALEVAAPRVHLERTALSACVAQAASELTLLAPGRPLNFEGRPAKISVLIDPPRLKELLANLVDNANKYSTPGDPVTVRLLREGTEIRIEVEDCGPGVPAEELERIFEPFHRSRTAGETPGKGLGLSICRMIAAAHGGRIWAERLPSGGFRVVVTLPAS